MSLNAIGRSARARHWIGSLAILVLSVRALVPTGFMLAQLEGRLSVVLCAVAAPTPTMPGMYHELHAHLATHAAHHMAAVSCPFAASGGAILVPQTFKAAEPYFVALRLPSAPAVFFTPAAPPPRHQAPRGPPALV